MYAHLPHALFFSGFKNNLYGSTEVTVSSVFCLLDLKAKGEDLRALISFYSELGMCVQNDQNARHK
jgi:hypothetical protein